MTGTNGSIRARRGPVELAARRAVARIDAPAGSDEAVLAQVVVSLAAATDHATSKGHASAAAMSARELREALVALRGLLAAGEGDEDPFERLVREMRESV